MVNGTLGTLDDDETGRGTPTKQHRSSPDRPGPGQQDALADDESPRLAKLTKITPLLTLCAVQNFAN